MKVLNMQETEVASGGVCEEMSLAQCIDGVGLQVAQEVEDFAGAVSGWWDSWCDYNNIGYWIYDMTHC